MKLPDDVLARLLAVWPVARLATVAAGGRPHAVPVVFCEYAGSIYSPLDGKRKSGAVLQRFTNLRDNPRATLLLDHYDADWQALWWVRIDGKAQGMRPDPAAAAAIAERLVEKYPQYGSGSVPFDASYYLQLAPSKTSVWAQTDAAGAISSAIARLP